MPLWEPGDFSARRWPEWEFWRDGQPGGRLVTRDRVVRLGVNVVALAGLVPRLVDIAEGDHDPVVAAILLVGGVVYGAGYLFAAWSGPACSHGRRAAIVAALIVLALLPALVLRSPAYMIDCTYAVAIAFMLLPLRYSAAVGAALAAGQIGWMWLTGRVDPAAVVTLVGVSAVLCTVFALLFTIGHLRAAREQVRRLAVVEERERVARDLHDILGHSLSTMTVKAGLARRLLESAGDVARATVEVREVEDLSREALSDVRATVSGYRTVTLSTEIAGARVALVASGIRADLPVAVDDVAPELREVFGYVVREAVTNVIRHSGATSCRIRIGRDRVTIIDDGGNADEGASRPQGNGLSGLAERLATVSGNLYHGPLPGGGFRVAARAPSPDLSGLQR
ncbi:histidine kinase [Pseudonocardia sp. KRD291]|uniref:sensor histidine kinase n=1 Tax=Pseudonocardia sp. KRD291 TaxID=2792007 RepID=UPI001C5C1F90|nr:histidine kinase [Pseudonocardia sp. KRD291]MBW0102700.1 two-component sensor histidine kinase [Pseudonocardia sp. KRD291]